MITLSENKQGLHRCPVCDRDWRCRWLEDECRAMFYTPCPLCPKNGGHEEEAARCLAPLPRKGVTMRFWHQHQWEEFHPSMYQDHVRMKRCGCGKVYHQGVRGECGQIIPYGFHALTKQPLFGASCSKNMKVAG